MKEHPVPEDQNLAKLYGWVRDIVQNEIHHNWLHGTAKPQRVSVGPPSEIGATDAIILQADVHVRIFVKMHPEDPEREFRGYDILCQGPQEFVKHLVPPIPSSLDSPHLLWLTPHVDATTLHQLVYRNSSSGHFNRWIKELYADFLRNMEELWTNTRTFPPPNLRQIYVERIWDKIGRMNEILKIDNIMDMHIRVNTNEYGLFSGLIDRFIDQVDSANKNMHFACTTHGDEHAKNIMVYEETISRKSSGWIIVDYVNAKKEADWIFSIAHMLQWWQFYYVLELAKRDQNLEQALNARMVLNDNVLTIEYNQEVLESHISSRCLELKQMLLTFTQRIAQDFGEDEQNWRQRLNLALFSVIFAAAPLHFGKADFALPIMIGESLKSLVGSSLTW